MKSLEDLAKFPSENPNPVLRVTKNKVLYINKAGELLFSIKEGDKIPKLFQGELTEALNKSILKTLEVEIDNLSYILDIAPIKEEGYANIYGRNITDLKATENVLKESEKKLKDIIEAIPIGILISNPEGTITEINSQVIKIFGYDSKKDFLKIPALDHYYNPADRDLFIKMLESGLVKNFELEFKRKDGTIFWGSVTSIATKIGNLTIYTDTFQDITERKRAEQNLKESEKKYRLLFENANDGISILDLEGNFYEVNDLYCTRLGYTREELLKSNIRDINVPEFADLVSDRIVDIKEKRFNVFESAHKTKDNRIIPVEISATSFIYENKPAILSIVRDITDRKNAEDQIVNLAKFPSENPFPVLRATKEKILYSNKAGEGLFKIKEGSRPPHKLLDWINKAIDLDTPQLIEIVFGDKTFLFNLLSIKDEGYVNIYGRDITERKYVEIELQKSEATYREAYKRAEFYKDIFTHDINNILQNISNGIQLNEMYLNKPEKSNAIKRNIDIIKRQVKRGANLVSNVRKLSKISESEAFLSNVNIIEVLKKSINYIKNSFHDKKIKIEFQIIENNYKILANELLEDVFDNILTNSINYNDNEFIIIEIKVIKELSQGINYIKLQFSDNGIGITDERKDQIFVRGYSEETSIHGMGLGLSLVKKIIESYNGEIWMEDRVKGDYTKGNNCIIVIPEVANNG